MSESDGLRPLEYGPVQQTRPRLDTVRAHNRSGASQRVDGRERNPRNSTQTRPMRPEPAWKQQPVAERRRNFALVVIALTAILVAGVMAILPDGDDAEAVPATTVAAAVTVAPTTVALAAGTDEESTEAEGDPERADGGCTIGALSIRLGASGDGVTCLQDALREVGAYSGTSTGEFDNATMQAVMEFQQTEDLFVDGVVGRESAIALDIWPDEESLVTRTPPPPEGATDSWGVTLSPVASTGDDAPPLPENSGSGRRVVYDRAGQRVWAISESGEIIRSWLVSGSTYQNELPGHHEVYSRSDMSTAWNGKAWLPLMIRWLKTERGAIGFHAIPLHVEDNSPYQGTDELGTRLSGGCQRQHNLDAQFLWAFATIGTPVIVT